MIRPTLLAFLATTALLSAQDDKAVADIVAKVNATGASLAPISADAKSYRFTALNVAKEFTDAGLAPLGDARPERPAAVSSIRTGATARGANGSAR